MEDIEEEQPSKTTNHSVQTGKNKETAKDNDNAQPTKEVPEQHTMTIRFKFNANTQLEAIKQHKRILSVFKTELGTPTKPARPLAPSAQQQTYPKHSKQSTGQSKEYTNV